MTSHNSYGCGLSALHRDLFMRGCRKLKSCMGKRETPAKTELDLTDPLEKIYCDTLVRGWPSEGVSSCIGVGSTSG